MSIQNVKDAYYNRLRDKYPKRSSIDTKGDEYLGLELNELVGMLMSADHEYEYVRDLANFNNFAAKVNLEYPGSVREFEEWGTDDEGFIQIFY